MLKLKNICVCIVQAQTQKSFQHLQWCGTLKIVWYHVIQSQEKEEEKHNGIQQNKE